MLTVNKRESKLWSDLECRTTGRDDIEMIRIENKLGFGTPDVHCSIIDGYSSWLELKALAPFKGKGGVDLGHFTVDQGRVLNRQYILGCNAFLLTKLPSGQIALHQGPFLFRNGKSDLHGLDATEFIYRAVRYTPGLPQGKALIDFLRLDTV